jgi:hypothetical protein
MNDQALVPVSLDPDTFVGTGFLEDKIAVIHEWSFGMYDFNGASDEDLPMLIANMTVEGSDKPRNEYWKMGAPDKVKPINDGKGLGLIPDENGRTKGLSNASKGYLLLKSLKDAGADPAAINGDISLLNDMRVQFVLLSVTAKDKDGKEFTYQVPIVNEILDMPGEASKSAAKTAEKETAKEEKAVEDDLKAAACSYLTEILKGNGGSLVRTGLAPLAFKAVPDFPDKPAKKSEIIGIMFDPASMADVIDEKDGIMTLK